RLSEINSPELRLPTERITRGLQDIEEYSARSNSSESEFQQAGARAFAFSIARTEAALLLTDFASAQRNRAAVAAAARWCSRGLVTLLDSDATYREESAAIEKGE
ncbi:MAG: hypothetical protein ACJ793_02450, partial [Gemmatimonadaceae bacterium]